MPLNIPMPDTTTDWDAIPDGSQITFSDDVPPVGNWDYAGGPPQGTGGSAIQDIGDIPTGSVFYEIPGTTAIVIETPNGVIMLVEPEYLLGSPTGRLVENPFAPIRNAAGNIIGNQRVPKVVPRAFWDTIKPHVGPARPWQYIPGNAGTPRSVILPGEGFKGVNGDIILFVLLGDLESQATSLERCMTVVNRLITQIGRVYDAIGAQISACERYRYALVTARCWRPGECADWRAAAAARLDACLAELARRREEAGAKRRYWMQFQCTGNELHDGDPEAGDPTGRSTPGGAIDLKRLMMLYNDGQNTLAQWSQVIDRATADCGTCGPGYYCDEALGVCVPDGVDDDFLPDDAAMQANLGLSSADPAFMSRFDYDGNGVVDFLDFAVYRQKREAYYQDHPDERPDPDTMGGN